MIETFYFEDTMRVQYRTADDILIYNVLNINSDDEEPELF